MRNSKRYSNASAISDRSGFRFPMREMVIEPGTGWLVHRSESDGEYSLVRHPLNNLAKYLKGKMGDPFPVENARPDRNWAENMVFQGETNISWSVDWTVTQDNMVFQAMASLSFTAIMLGRIFDWSALDWNNSDWQTP